MDDDTEISSDEEELRAGPGPSGGGAKQPYAYMEALGRRSRWDII
jgi:hypothetical protein